MHSQPPTMQPPTSHIITQTTPIHFEPNPNVMSSSPSHVNTLNPSPNSQSPNPSHSSVASPTPSSPNDTMSPTSSPTHPTSSSHSLHTTSSSATASPTPTNPLPTSPTRKRKPNSKYFNPQVINTTTLHPIPSTLEPTTHTQALKDTKWRQAMDSEFNALIHNQTWELVPRTSQTPIGCKWVFRIKRNADGSIDKYKARLVAKGFHQQYGKDYFDTFSPVTKPVTIRTVLSIALSKNWPLRQLDVNNAFLHGTLQEEVFMVQPPGFVHPQFPNHICRLRKSLYGLKQAPRTWYLELTNFLLSSGFRKSQADASLFIFHHNDIIAYFMVYVDDIVLTGNNSAFLEHFVNMLSRRFSVKDLGPLHHFLGIEVISTPTGLLLSQHRHIHDLLSQVHMDGAKEVLTPLSSSDPLNPNDSSSSVDPTPYRRLIGSLQYLAFTRPDISFAVNKLSQFMHSPKQSHWQSLKRVLRYLKGTIHYGLFLHRGIPLNLTAFSDSDWGGIHDGGRSTTAYILYLGSNIISWKSTRQKSVSRSSTEAEYKALANATAEISWVQHLLAELGIHLSQPPTLFCDNTGATYLCANPVYHSRMKHVALDYHFVREKVSNGSLKVFHINSKDQLADVLTKPLSRVPFLQIRSKIGVSNGASILRGRITDKHG
ncbi:putative RNA-directed DNA polymerase [Helianthus annuus]|nr:putative RNA-directed DNA polymerase [Helianthus annuus]